MDAENHSENYQLMYVTGVGGKGMLLASTMILGLDKAAVIADVRTGEISAYTIIEFLFTYDEENDSYTLTIQ